MRRIGGVVFFALVAAGCTGSDSVTYQANDNGDGIFVSSDTGSDANDGTKVAPVRTIGRALSLLGNHSNIYVCAGNYAEQVSLDGSTAVQGIYGGFDCSTWQYSAGNKPVVRSPSSDYALKIANVPSSITISDIEFDAHDATNPGGSSIAAFVLNSKDVKFVRSTLVAGSGQNGASGQTGSNYGVSPAPSGNSTQGTTGGAAQTACVCNDGTHSTGGAGGTFIWVGNQLQDGFQGSPGLPDLGGGQGGNMSACASGGNGVAGASGAMGQDGSAVAAPPAGTATSALGSLDDLGWHTAMSAAGTTPGAPGQGGGGGGAGNISCPTNMCVMSVGSSGAGGSGGCGGCGGAAGGPAQGGGASLTLVSLQSTITLTNSSLVVGQAGNGGSGAAGQPGQAGGAGGDANLTYGCPGGAGGKGGAGGASAGGAGGIAAGVLWVGDGAPTLDDATSANVVTGRAGQGGSGGNPGVNDGPSGVKGVMLQVTP